MREVPATEFTGNFGQHQELAQDEPVAVTRHGGRSRAVVDMTKEEIGQMAASRMAPEHDHLDALLDKE